MKRDCRRDGELSPEGLTHCRSSRSSPAVWPQRGLGDPRPGIPTFTSPGVSSRPKAQKLLPSSPPAVPAENVSLLGGWVLATTVGQHCGRLPRSPLRSADRVEVATVANRLRTVTDGQGYFTFSLFCLEFMLTKRKKKKKDRKDFLETGSCLLCFTRCLKGTRFPSASTQRRSHRLRPISRQSLASPNANQAPRLTKKRQKMDILLVPKKPKAIFTNKVFDDAGRNFLFIYLF